MAGDYFQEAVQRYEQLSGLEAKRQTASGLTEDIYRSAESAAASKLDSLCSRPEVIDTALGHLQRFLLDKSDLDLLAETDGVDQALVTERRAVLATRLVSPEFAFTRRFLGDTVAQHFGDWSQFEPGELGSTSEQFAGFFSQPLEAVADALDGKLIKAGRGKTFEITSILTQDESYNERWLRSRPIFGEDRVGVYVAGYMGKPMLFVSAGDTSSCIRINAVSRQNEVYKNSAQVCGALGLERETIGDRSFDGQVLSITNLRPRPKK